MNLRHAFFAVPALVAITLLGVHAYQTYKIMGSELGKTVVLAAASGQPITNSRLDRLLFPTLLARSLVKARPEIYVNLEYLGLPMFPGLFDWKLEEQSESVQDDFFEFIDWMLANGQDINQRTCDEDEWGASMAPAIEFAILNRSELMIGYLLDRGASLDISSPSRRGCNVVTVRDKLEQGMYDSVSSEIAKYTLLSAN